VVASLVLHPASIIMYLAPLIKQKNAVQITVHYIFIYPIYYYAFQTNQKCAAKAFSYCKTTVNPYRQFCTGYTDPAFLQSRNNTYREKFWEQSGHILS
jgi:hypothetical protein